MKRQMLVQTRSRFPAESPRAGAAGPAEAPGAAMAGNDGNETVSQHPRALM